MKKLVSLALAATLSAASFAAFAAEDGVIMPIAENTENFTSITVNGEHLEGKKTITVNDKVMIPLRAITEALGFEVTWNAEGQKIELIKMPVYITLSAGADGYSFSKTAPMMLGSAPVIFENYTYVPLNFIDEILGGTYTTVNGLDITWGEAVTEPMPEPVTDEGVTAYAKEETEDGILIEEFARGEVRLVITEDTVIENASGEAITAEDIDFEKELYVVYSEAMTMSIPPMTNAVKITVTEEAKKEIIAGEVTEVTEDEGAVLLTIGENEKVVVIGADTKVTNTAGEETEAEFEAGMSIRALSTGMATRSIPPQYPVSAVIVID